MDITNYRSDIAQIIQSISTNKLQSLEETVSACNQLIEYADSRRDNRLLGYGHYEKGRAYYNSNHIPEFYLEMINSINPYVAARAYKELADAYLLLGRLAGGRKDYSAAMDYYLKAKDYYQMKNDEDGLCIAEINIGRLFNEVGDADMAIEHLSDNYKYISNHTAMTDYVGALTNVLIDLGRAKILNSALDEAVAYKQEIENKAAPYLKGDKKIRTECFYAALANANQDEEGFKNAITVLKEEIKKNFPILEVYKDLSEICGILVQKEAYEDFYGILTDLIKTVQAAGLKRLEKDYLELYFTCLQKQGKSSDFDVYAERYVGLLEQIKTEKTTMLSATASLRYKHYSLEKELEKEKETAKVFKKKSESDPISGIPNRVKLDEYLNQAFERSISNENSFAIELLVVDYFSEYEDNYGHYRGDECLGFIANKLFEIQNAHEGVFCASYGTDTFVLVYEGYSEEEAFKIAKELKNNIVTAKRINDFAEGTQKIITVSQGIYWGTPKAGENVYAYLNEADLLLYKVKQKSTNSIMLDKASTNEALSKLKEESSKIIITEPIQSSYEHYGQG